jgi:hypothetical protein
MSAVVSASSAVQATPRVRRRLTASISATSSVTAQLSAGSNLLLPQPPVVEGVLITAGAQPPPAETSLVSGSTQPRPAEAVLEVS